MECGILIYVKIRIMKYLKTTFLGAIAITIFLFISKYIGHLVNPYLNKKIPTNEEPLIGILIFMLIICGICLCYFIGRLIQLFIKF